MLEEQTIQFQFSQIQRQKGETRLLLFASHVLLVSRFESFSEEEKNFFFLPVLSFSPISPYQVFLEFLSKKNVNAGDDP